MKTHLVQLVSLRDNPDPTKNAEFDKVYELEYMGSAEFEFGAVPNSLNHIIENQDEYLGRELGPLKNVHGEQCYYFGSNDSLIDILTYVTESIKDPYHPGLKEMDYLSEQVKSDQNPPSIRQGSRYELWWDIENHFFICFGEESIKRLETTISKSKQTYFK